MTDLLRKNRFYIIFVSLCVYILILNMLSFYVSEDTYFLLSTGKEIYTNGMIHENPFFVLPGYNLVVQQWLYDVILYILYMTMGNFGIFLMAFSSSFFCAMVMYKLSQIFNVNRLTAIIIIVTFLFVNMGSMTSRPTMLTVGLLFLQVFFCEKFKNSCLSDMWNVKYLIYIIFISIIELNVHACLWFMHVIILLPYICPAIKIQSVHLKHCNDKIRSAFLITAAIIIFTCFVNPYGINGFMSLFNSNMSELTAIGISELQPVNLLSMSSLIMIFSLAYVIYVKDKFNEIPCEYAYMFSGLIIFGSIYPRNIIYGMMGIVIMFFYLLKNKTSDSLHAFASGRTWKTYVMLGIISAMFTSAFLDRGGIYQIKDTEMTPVKAVEWLDVNARKNDTVCTMFSNGAYIEWSGYKIYMENRTEGYFEKINKKEDIMAEFIKLLDGFTIEEYEMFMDKYKFDYVITDSVATAFDIMIKFDNDMELVVQGNGYRLYKNNRICN